MADLTATVTPATIPASAGALTEITWETAPTGGEVVYMPNDGRTALLVYNDTGGAAAISIDSVDDPYGREDDIAAATLANTKYGIIGPFPPGLWNQDGTHAGQVKITFDVACKVRAIRL